MNDIVESFQEYNLWLLRESNLFENDWANYVEKVPHDLCESAGTADKFFDARWEKDGADEGETTVTYTLEANHQVLFSKTFQVSQEDVLRGKCRK